jgi:hypothetical protein
MFAKANNSYLGFVLSFARRLSQVGVSARKAEDARYVVHPAPLAQWLLLLTSTKTKSRNA